MVLQTCLRSHLYKGLVTLVLAVIILQYCFSSVFDAVHLEPLFSINSTQSRTKTVTKHQRQRGLLFADLPVNTSSPAAAHHNASISRKETSDNFSSDTPLSHLDATNITHSPASVHSVLLSTIVPISGKKLCPPIPPDLKGPVKVILEPPTIEEMEKMFPLLEIGGRYKPSQCQARDRVAIIIPYRDRMLHLRTLLRNLHPLLQRQQLDYGVYVIEQEGNGPFNRAMLMNIGFKEASKLYDFDCFIFHDVDLLPEDDRNLYTCPEQPRHMSVAVDVLKYRLPYADIFGGVSAMTKTQFEKVNGFSNMFWGWGGEDDDMSNRLKFRGYHISRYPANIARYKMLNHRKQRANPKRYEYLNTGRKRFDSDGLNSLKYDRKSLDLNRLYTRILVELPTPS